MAKVVGSWQGVDSSAPKKTKGLREKQIRTLQVLSESKGMLSKDLICTRVPMHPTTQWVIFVGSTNDEKRSAREGGSGFPTLLTLGYIEYLEIEVEGFKEVVYRITPAGREALEKYTE